jgi:hypothetical protein
MSRNIPTKDSNLPRKNPTGKKVTKPLPTKPVLNSIVRLEERVVSTRNDLAAATSGGSEAGDIAIALARNRIVHSPRTNRQFRKVVARDQCYKTFRGRKLRLLIIS